MAETVVTVDSESAGVRLDRFLARRFRTDNNLEGYSRAELQRLISERQIILNGHHAKASVKLKPNDVVQLRSLPPRDSPLIAENIPLDILYEDQHCIVINKAAGSIVHPAAGKLTGTLVNALLYHCPDLGGIGGERRPGIIHRLDKDTSGVMVIAKTAMAFERIARQFKDRQVQKVYVALVWGKLVGDSGVIVQPIGRHRSDRKRMSSRYSLGNRRDAVTQWHVEKLFKIKSSTTTSTWVSRLRLNPKTGRTHQLRVHLADFGFPIVGDMFYGHKKRFAAGKKIFGCKLEVFPRQALHALKLSFIHPVTENLMTFRAPLPDDMRDLIKFLDENNLSEGPDVSKPQLSESEFAFGSKVALKKDKHTRV